ncbi:uncharacterized protein BYT42DRAFT_179478 [Radiomyces spectabilis]|uniref:uncharacterized protein n=1 Tax=Radiomyces spectabilis TaxID=64574 RepID=UPI00221E560B|nr:uncharacterized protein BYT42DRAFT_179478 [Radiomyces spectabilis]KAI8391029.1 hypothetical protein BYT42DRAFT_179478 [Radiomyces spectabilis]
MLGLDPGHTHVFTASYGQGEGRHQVRRCSTKEYYTLTGSVRHAKEERRRMDRAQMTDLFLNISTAKTVSPLVYHRYLTYILDSLPRILRFNGPIVPKAVSICSKACRGREPRCNIITNGGIKYNKEKRKHT